MDTIPEILEQVNRNPKSIMVYKGNNYLRSLLEAAFIPSKKLNLPEGNPPYTPLTVSDYEIKGSFWQVARKINIFMETRTKPMQRERTFIQALESIAAKEAQILLHVKDQTLPEMYPNVTYEALQEVGYFPKV